VKHDCLSIHELMKIKVYRTIYWKMNICWPEDSLNNKIFITNTDKFKVNNWPFPFLFYLHGKLPPVSKYFGFLRFWTSKYFCLIGWIGPQSQKWPFELIFIIHSGCYLSHALGGSKMHQVLLWISSQVNPIPFVI
jgi:hypothetical protein